MNSKLDELANKLCGLSETLHDIGWPVGMENIRQSLTEAYQLGREDERAELAAELTGGSSILRDPAAVVDISQVVDNPAGDAWMDEG